MMAEAPRLAAISSLLMAFAEPASAQQVEEPSSANRAEASQIELPAQNAPAGPGRAYLDETSRLPASRVPNANRTGNAADQISQGPSNAPARQISALDASKPAIAQLSRSDLEASLAQLTAAERRVLFDAIAGSDICNDPPRVAAIVALCAERIETRSADFTASPERILSAEDRLLNGDLESATRPSLAQVIERLARGGASSEDFSNQAIASIVLGTGSPATALPREEDVPEEQSLGEEAQALINALVNQFGGGTP